MESERDMLHEEKEQFIEEHVHEEYIYDERVHSCGILVPSHLASDKRRLR